MLSENLLSKENRVEEPYDNIDDKLSWKHRITYAMPKFSIVGMNFLMMGATKKYYADNLGMGVAVVSTVVAATKCFDLFFDAFFAYVSDSVQTKWGRRKPALVLSAFVYLIAVVCLTAPPEGVHVLSWFFIFYFLASTIGYSATAITYDSWGYELTSDYHEKSLLFGVTNVSQSFALIAGAVLSMALAMAFPDSVGTQNFFSASFFAAMMLIGVLVAIKVNKDKGATTSDGVKFKSPPIIPILRRMMNNRPFVIYTIARLPGTVGGIMPGTLLVFYIQYVLKSENAMRDMGFIMMATIAGALLSISGIMVLSRKIGKHKTLVVCLMTMGTCMCLITALPTAWGIVPLIAFGVLSGSGQAAINALPPALLADIVDYDELYSGRRLEAMFAAVESNIQKFVEIPAGVVPMLILGGMGYMQNGGCDCGCGVTCKKGEHASPQWTGCYVTEHPDIEYGNAPCTYQPEDVRLTLLLMMMLISGLLFILSALLYLKYPLSKEKHDKILEALKEKKEMKDGVLDPLTGKLVPAGINEDEIDVCGHFYDWQLSHAVAKNDPSSLKTTTLATLSVWVTALIALVTATTLVVVGDPTLSTYVISGASLLLSLLVTCVIWDAARLRALFSWADKLDISVLQKAGDVRPLEREISMH